MRLFYQSLTRHAGWWITSLWPGRHEGAPLSTRRLLFLFLGYPAFLALQLLHWMGFLCDEIFFSAYRKVTVKAPVFIIGIPRSGTTYLHRSLAEDQEQFTSVSTWEALLAPSITERKLIGGLQSLDRFVGRPLHHLIKKGLRTLSTDLDHIHEVALSAPEEDYLCLLPAGACFILLLAFPFSDQLRQLGRLDAMSPAERDRVLDFYKRTLQRHLYCHPGKGLLSKNAAYASWAGALQATFPDAKFLVCIRKPISALSSQLSALAPARALFATDPEGTTTTRLFTAIYAHSYESLARFIESSGPSQVALIEQADMKTAPAEIITGAIKQIGLKAGPALQTLKPASPSTHQHAPDDFCLDLEAIQHSMHPYYETMLHSPNRILKNEGSLR